MFVRYIIYLTLSSIIIIFSWYYVICFCGIYYDMRNEWFKSCVYYLLFSFLFYDLLIPSLLISIRYAVRNRNSCVYNISLN